MSCSTRISASLTRTAATCAAESACERRQAPLHEKDERAAGQQEGQEETEQEARGDALARIEPLPEVRERNGGHRGIVAPGSAYSYRSASIGSSCDALRAG